MSEFEDHTLSHQKQHLQDILDCAAEAREEGFHDLADAFDKLYKLAVQSERVSDHISR